jgi:hypothetical protein
MMRKISWIISLVFAVLIMPTVLRADGIVYTVNQTEGAFTVTGTITTDGAIGVLSSADIVGWNLMLNSITLNTGNSTMLLVGDALSATTGQLTFDFTAGGSSNSYLNFHDPSYVSWWYRNRHTWDTRGSLSLTAWRARTIPIFQECK